MYKKLIKNLILVSFILVLSAFYCFSQTINGIVRDHDTKLPLAYATISVIKKDLRTIARKNGTFSLNTSSLHPNDSVVISYIGYQKLQYAVKDLNGSEEQEILMKRNILALDPVAVMPGEKKTVKIGYTKAGRRRTGWGDFDTGRGRTRGTLIKNIGNPAILKSFFLRINDNDWDSVAFRLDLVSIRNGQPSESILKRDVIFRTGKRHKWIEVNLEDQNISVSDQILATVEWVDAWGSVGEYSNVLTLSLSNEPGFVYSKESNKNSSTYNQENNVPAMYIDVFD